MNRFHQGMTVVQIATGAHVRLHQPVYGVTWATRWVSGPNSSHSYLTEPELCTPEEWVLIAATRGIT